MRDTLDELTPTGETVAEYRLRYVKARLLDNLLSGVSASVIIEELRRLRISLRFSPGEYYILLLGFSRHAMKQYLGSDERVLMELSPRIAEHTKRTIAEHGYIYDGTAINPEKLGCYLISPEPEKKQTATVETLAEKLVDSYLCALSELMPKDRLRRCAYAALSDRLSGLSETASACERLRECYRLAFFRMERKVITPSWINENTVFAFQDEVVDALRALFSELRQGTARPDALSELILDSIKNSFDFSLCTRFVGVFSLEYRETVQRFSPETTSIRTFDECSWVTVEEMCSELCSAFSECAELSKKRRPANLVTGRAVRLLKKNYASPCALADVASELGVSTRYLRRVFSQDIGIGPHEYLTELRIDKSKALLNGGAPIKEVCAMVGIENAAYFSKYFKKHTGVSPCNWVGGYGQNL